MELAPQAARDITDITRASRRKFGDNAALRYRSLILAGIEALADEPAQRTAKTHEDVNRRAWVYHLRHTRQIATPRIRTPRHLIVYSFDDEWLRVIRVLHDAMDLPKQMSGR